VHLLFGYLQIGNVINTAKMKQVPAWLENHPHTSTDRLEDSTNTIYIANEKATWNDKISGWGTFRYDDSIVLTKAGYSRSRWNLPQFFKEVEITYHTPKSWKDGYFQSAARGQEFVISENKKVEQWATKLIDNNSQQ
jgi:hypothetical protein